MSAPICPRCRSSATRVAPAFTARKRFAASPARLCLDCFAEFTPALPRWQGVVIMVLGLFASFAGVMLIYHTIFLAWRSGQPMINPLYTLAILGVGVFGLYSGVLGLLRRPTVREATPEQRNWISSTAQQPHPEGFQARQDASIQSRDSVKPEDQATPRA
jgi:hypothetical protein